MNIVSAPGPTGDLTRTGYDVVVVGGGPVGLATAIELGRRHLTVLLVERDDGVIRYPTAESVDVASMELLRRWGMAHLVEQAGFPADEKRDIAFVSRMTTYELARFPRPSNAERRSTTQGLSPEGGGWWPKFWFDPALRARAQAEPTVELRYGWLCESVEDGPEDVCVRLSSAEHGERVVHARYVVACDGAGSPIRRALGIASIRDVSDTRARWQGAFTRLPGLRERTAHAPAVQYYLMNPRRMILGSLDGADLWRVTYPLLDGEQPTAADVRNAIVAALDCEADDVEVLDTREWSGDAVVAETFQSGHVLLAGDSAHRMWPSGGHGMNTGLGDVANLGWKVEAVLRGWSPPALLDTYTTERRPHCERMVRRAWANYRADLALLSDPGLDDSERGTDRDAVTRQIIGTRQSEWRSLGLQLGLTYNDSPLVVPDDTPEPAPSAEDYIPTARPGHRAPHVTLPDGASTLDLFRGHFTVLYLDSAVGGDDLAEAMRRRAIPVDEAWAGTEEARGVFQCAVALIRPDGIVAWRGAAMPEDPEHLIDQVTGRIRTRIG